LIFTYEDGMVANLETMAPLGKSDHAVISFELNSYIKKDLSTMSRRNYNKGDSVRLRKELDIKWNLLLDQLHGDAESQFKIFQEISVAAIDRCIPSISTQSNINKYRPSMDKDIRALIRRKHHLWTRYMETQDINNIMSTVSVKTK